MHGQYESNPFIILSVCSRRLAAFAAQAVQTDFVRPVGRPCRAPKNPFKIPPDETIFTMREKEKEARRKYTEEMRNKPVAAKTTFASRMAATVPVGAESCRKGPPRLPAVPDPGKGHPAAAIPAEAEKTLAAAAAPGGRRQMHQRVRMSDFIAKKREIFLVQMSLDVKRSEIRKLEQRILQRCVAGRRRAHHRTRMLRMHTGARVQGGRAEEQ
jgi:hypothetical protein